MSELRFIELNEDKSPKTSYDVTYPSMDHLNSAGIMLNNNVVLVDFDGDNGEKEKGIIEYIKLNYPTLTITTTKGYHFYFSKPSDIVIKSKSDVITAGGFQVDYKTGNQYGIVKRCGVERERNRDLTLTNLPILPPILYPLSIKTNLSNMCDGDGRNVGINAHLYCLKQSYPTLNIAQIGEFINQNIFGEVMENNELDSVVKSVLASDPLSNMEIYKGSKKDMISAAKWIVKKLDIKLYNGQLYFKTDGKYISNETLLLREIAKYIELTRNKDSELNHQLYKYADLIDSGYDKFKIQLRNGYIFNNHVVESECDFTPFYLDVLYDKNAYDENVDTFLNFISFGKKDLRLVLEEVLGHIILVNRFPHKIFFLTGNGKNGKSTFIKLITNFTGDLASYVDIADFDDGTSLTSLIGKIVNVSDDVDSVYLEKSKNLKTMASGDKIGTRAIYSKPISIKNTASLIFTANEPPSFKDKSNGLIRRLVIVPFENVVEKRNPYIDEELSTDNAKSYILNLALEGVQRLFDNDLELSTSSTINEATKQYHIENDSVLSYLEEQSKHVIGRKVTEAYHYYEMYTQANKLKTLSPARFSRRLNALGYKSRVVKDEFGASVRKIFKEEE